MSGFSSDIKEGAQPAYLREWETVSFQPQVETLAPELGGRAVRVATSDTGASLAHAAVQNTLEALGLTDVMSVPEPEAGTEEDYSQVPVPTAGFASGIERPAASISA